MSTLQSQENTFRAEFSEINMVKDSDQILYCIAGFISMSEKGAMLFHHTDEDDKSWLICIHCPSFNEHFQPTNPHSKYHFTLAFPIMCLARFGKWTPRIAIPPDTKEKHIPLIDTPSGYISTFFESIITKMKECEVENGGNKG